jgi:hypothetical protein
LLEAIQDPAQRRRTMRETSLQVSDGVLSAVGEQRKDVRFPL